MFARLILMGSLLLAAEPVVSGSVAWQRIPLFETEPVYSLYAHGDSIWIGVEHGLRISADGGSTWSAIYRVGSTGVTGIAGARGKLAACEDSRIYLSDDGGISWSFREFLPAKPCLGIIARRDTLFAWYPLEEHPDTCGVRLSADGGLSWQDGGAGSPPAPLPVSFRGRTYGFSGSALVRQDGPQADTLDVFWHDILALAGAGEKLFLLRTEGLFASAVPESAWSPVLSHPAEIRDVAASGGRIAVATNQAVYFSRNGKDWRYLTASSEYWSPYRQYLSFGADRLFIIDSTINPRIRRYFPDRDAWDTDSLPIYNGGSGMSSYFAFAASGNRAAFTTTGNPWALMISEDNGEHFRAVGLLPGSGYFGGAVPLLAFSGTHWLFFRDHYTWRSEDEGRNWWPMTGCGGTLNLLPRFALNDSDLYIARNDSILRIPLASSACPGQSIPLPEGVKLGASFNIAMSGDSLYLGSDNGLWIARMEGSQASIHSGRMSRPPRASTPRFPVRAWNHPRHTPSGAPDEWFDAKGALRRQPGSARKP